MCFLGTLHADQMPEAKGEGLDPMKHVKLPTNLLLTVARRYFCYFFPRCNIYVCIYMSFSSVVGLVAVAFCASWFSIAYSFPLPNALKVLKYDEDLILNTIYPHIMKL